MVRAIQGTYREGKIVLDERPHDVVSARVYVLFVPDETTAESEQRRQQAMDDLLAHMKKGYDFGGPPFATREEIYDRGNQE
jgi:hypothetical protein